MKNTFSFNGYSIEDIGLHYVPERPDTYVYNTASSKIHEEIFDSHEGGYFYGSTLQPKTFKLRCYYEATNNLNGLITRTERVFKIGTVGPLKFSNRSWLTYNATVTNLDVTSMLNNYNGFVTIELKAYYPYSEYSDVGYIEADDDIINNSYLININQTPSTEFNDPINSTKVIPVYNGGTKNAKVKLHISGSVNDGVVFNNSMNKSRCKIVALNSTGRSHHVICDGKTGKTYWSDTGEMAFLYHDYGFIELAPNYYTHTDVEFNINDSTITCDDPVFNFNDVGMYIINKNESYKIEEVINSNTVKTSLPADTHSFTGTIAEVNEITVSPVSDMNINYLELEYLPTFA